MILPALPPDVEKLIQEDKYPEALVFGAAIGLLAGLIGSELGSRRLTPMTMRRLLAAVLVVAGIKMLLPR